MRELLVEPDLQMAVRVFIQVPLKVQEVVIGPVLRAGPEKDKLASVGKRIEERIPDKVDPLLVVQPAHIGHDRLVRLAQKKPVAQGLLVSILFLQRSDVVPMRDMPVY